MKDNIALESGFVFDYANMLGKNRIQEADIISLKEKIDLAVQGVQLIRSRGIAKGHLSASGAPEPVFFARLPFVREGYPTTPDTMEHLRCFGSKVWDTTDVVLFLGIGGSYLGSRVLFDVQAGDYWNERDNQGRKGYPLVYFSGNNLDADKYQDLLSELVRKAKNRQYQGLGKTKVMLVPVSKSGTTLELNAALVYFYDAMTGYKDLFSLSGAAVTDLHKEDNNLKAFAQKKGWELFDIKEGIGGRFSVLAEPGLVTAAVIGMDFAELLHGAQDMEQACQSANVYDNPALMNAVLKYLASERYGCNIEVFMPYSMRLKSLSEWYVQLLAESLGKRKDRDGCEVFYGRTPIAAVGTTDMHAQTQQHQDGCRNKVVQFLEIMRKNADLTLAAADNCVDGYEQFKGMNVDAAQRIALQANAQALSEDERFNANYILPYMTPYYLGQIFYFLMLSVAYEGELANVDAYDQPGVEAYKRIMKCYL